MAVTTPGHMAPPDFSTINAPFLVALIHVFNEELILEATLRYLKSLGEGVYIMDNASKDRTVEIARAYAGSAGPVLGMETIVSEDPERPYNLKQILIRKAKIAWELGRRGARWASHYDADEFRESPWDGVSYVEGLRRVEEAGYNMIDHKIVQFVPVDEGYSAGMDPLPYFKYHVPWTRKPRRGSTWRQGRHIVDLHTHGGHFLKFPGRRDYPLPFVIKHYAILNTDHGIRKVFQERRPRYSKEGLNDGWHKHYNDIKDEKHKFVYPLNDPELLLYDDKAFKADLRARFPVPEPGFFQRLFQRKPATA